MPFHYHNPRLSTKEDWAQDVSELVTKIDPSEELRDTARMSKRDLETLARVLQRAVDDRAIAPQPRDGEKA